MDEIRIYKSKHGTGMYCADIFSAGTILCGSRGNFTSFRLAFEWVQSIIDHRPPPTAEPTGYKTYVRAFIFERHEDEFNTATLGCWLEDHPDAAIVSSCMTDRCLTVLVRGNRQK
jgi:hypothetical protein